jgi:protein-S-isoprenylcysteine O-methyltransferase Ste14
VIIKIILLAGVLGFMVLVFRGYGGAGQLAIRRMVAILLALLGVLAVLMPDAVTWLANRVGVSRGTDLILYLLVVAFLWATVALHRRIEDLERRYIDLVRLSAIVEAMEANKQFALQSEQKPSPQLEANRDPHGNDGT